MHSAGLSLPFPNKLEDRGIPTMAMSTYLYPLLSILVQQMVN